MQWWIMAMKKYATFTGRSRRKEFWMFWLLCTVVTVSLQVTVAMLAMSGSLGLMGLLGGLIMIWNLGILIPYIAVMVRRIHDSGKSGWFILVPFYNLYLLIKEGDSGDNKYGTNPKVAA